jgi:hypothetical protein
MKKTIYNNSERVSEEISETEFFNFLKGDCIIFYYINNSFSTKILNRTLSKKGGDIPLIQINVLEYPHLVNIHNSTNCPKIVWIKSGEVVKVLKDNPSLEDLDLS